MTGYLIVSFLHVVILQVFLADSYLYKVSIIPVGPVFLKFFLVVFKCLAEEHFGIT